jgi:hypothetical protein
VLRRAQAVDPIPFRVRLGGEAPGAAHGLDIDVDGRGLLDDDRLYQLIRRPDAIEDRTFEITFGCSRVEGYVFTFE